MPSEVDLLNDALSQIGVAPITAIDDGSVTANHCQRLYPALRDSLLRMHHWNFAITRVQLAVDPVAPVSEWAYQYALPSDCLKVVDYSGVATTTPPIYDPTVTRTRWRYTIEGRMLLTNDSQVYLTYLQRVTNPDRWDSLFYQMAAAWLAGKLASAINHDEKMSLGKIEEAVKVLLPIALAADGQEGTRDPIQADDLIRVR